ncbi:MAG: hypothetical protein Q8Q19_06545 [Microbacterium sp.]|nr:hypothetical protein [Microbacterium sp.]MDP3950301.1 hypothetical protein [Microbacterium sp.]
MTSVRTMVRARAKIDDAPYLLAQEQDLDELKRSFETAMRSGGAFVEFTVVGNEKVSTLVTPNTRVVLSEATVEIDQSDNGDQGFPYVETYDY